MSLTQKVMPPPQKKNEDEGNHDDNPKNEYDPKM